jgi:hypothetical protein
MRALRDAAVLRQDDWEVLSTAYIDLYTLRNRAWLRDEHSDDNAPDSSPRELQAKRKQVREIFERLFLEKA